MAEPATYKRPPVPSAEESSRTGMIAPIAAYCVFMVFGGMSVGNPAMRVAAGIICPTLVLLGFAASAWGFYVATFYGPRKHITSSVIGFALNVAIIAVPLYLASSKAQKSAGNDGQYETHATAQTTGRYFN